MFKVTRKTTLPTMFKDSVFDSYDKARCAIRSWLRKTGKVACNTNIQSIREFGFSIQRI